MHMAFQMVVFMLDDAGADAGELLFMFHEVLVEVTQADAVGAHHILIDAGKAQAALLERHILAEGVHQLGVDEDLLEAFALWVIGIEGITVHDEKTDGLVHLGSGKADALGMRQGLPHVGEQFLQLREVLVNVFGH